MNDIPPASQRFLNIINISLEENSVRASGSLRNTGTDGDVSEGGTDNDVSMSVDDGPTLHFSFSSF